MTFKTSESGTKDFQIFDLYPYLTWLNHCIQPRDTLHYMHQEESESNTYDDIDTYEFDDNTSLASFVSATGSNLSSVTGR